MRIPIIIESKHWVNTVTGQTASPYGAVPYTDQDKVQWELVTRGFTFKYPDGTIGCGRQPFKTLDEAAQALEHLKAHYQAYERAVNED